jgi:hypothetical protein
VQVSGNRGLHFARKLPEAECCFWDFHSCRGIARIQAE